MCVCVIFGSVLHTNNDNIGRSLLIKRSHIIQFYLTLVSDHLVPDVQLSTCSESYKPIYYEQHVLLNKWLVCLCITL